MAPVVVSCDDATVVLVTLALGVLAGGVAVAVAQHFLLRARSEPDRLGIEELERLRRAEVALAAAPTTHEAARELAKHAMALLDAPAAVVLIEGIGDTTRVESGDTTGHSIYAAGSRMRLLQDDGAPVGSIVVAARGERDFDERDESVLDALGERVSSTLHRLSLLEAVQAEQRTLADVLVSSSDGIASIGPDLRVRSWNPAMARLTGVAEVVAIGQTCCSVFRPFDEHGSALHGATCPCRTGEQAEALAQLRPDDTSHEREPLWLNCAFSPMSDGGTVVVARDVTARKQVDDEKADFLATVSHELRTPLTPIKGFLQTLLRRDHEFGEAERQHIYEVMLREESRLERLVQQLLQATSLENAEDLADPAVIDWARVVSETVADARRQDPDREISLILAPELPDVTADIGLARQALGNLISNALKFSPPGSDVGVAVVHEGDLVVTSVADRGPGVPDGVSERIFEKFTRLGDHLTRAQQGVGLGLYIARRAVEAMGGRVWVDPVPGGGSTFSFSLPVAVAERVPIRTP